MNANHSLIFSMICCLSMACGGSDGDDNTDARTDASQNGVDAANAIDAMLIRDAGPPDAAPICNSLNNAAPEITARRSAQAMPSPTGGTIQDGLYYLISDTFYDAGQDMDLGPEQATIDIAGATMQQAFSAQGEPPTLSTNTITTPGGSAILLTQVCPGNFDLRWDGYTVQADTLELHWSTANRVQVFTLQ